jgi:hypothetical protein
MGSICMCGACRGALLGYGWYGMVRYGMVWGVVGCAHLFLRSTRDESAAYFARAWCSGVFTIAAP